MPNCLMQLAPILVEIFLVCSSQRIWFSILGGWGPLDVKNGDAKLAALYAVSKTYPSTRTSIKIVTGRVQVVGAYKYDMNVAVTILGSRRSCSMQNYVVVSSGNYPQTSTYTLLSNTPLTTQKCRSKWAAHLIWSNTASIWVRASEELDARPRSSYDISFLYLTIVMKSASSERWCCFHLKILIYCFTFWVEINLRTCTKASESAREHLWTQYSLCNFICE